MHCIVCKHIDLKETVSLSFFPAAGGGNFLGVRAPAFTPQEVARRQRQREREMAIGRTGKLETRNDKNQLQLGARGGAKKTHTHRQVSMSM